jgi:hypothetical protein
MEPSHAEKLGEITATILFLLFVVYAVRRYNRKEREKEK